jgi:hypothetical protein
MKFSNSHKVLDFIEKKESYFVVFTVNFASKNLFLNGVIVLFVLLECFMQHPKGIQ